MPGSYLRNARATCTPPRRQTHFEPLLIELYGILIRGEQYPRGPTAAGSRRGAEAATPPEVSATPPEVSATPLHASAIPTTALKAAAAAVLAIGPGGYCTPRQPTHCESSFLE
jgi:hypothetical protein